MSILKTTAVVLTLFLIPVTAVRADKALPTMYSPVERSLTDLLNASWSISNVTLNFLFLTDREGRRNIVCEVIDRDSNAKSKCFALN